MPHISADDSAALAAVLFALAWLGFWIDRQPFSGRIPGVPCVIAAGVLLSNIGVIPLQAPAYSFVFQYVLPLGIPLLLFKANLRSIVRDGGVVLVAFLIASLGICIGAVGGYLLFDLGEDGAKVAATYAGAFIGGVVNFVAISQAVEMTPTQFSVALGASSPASILGLIALVSVPSIALLRTWMPSQVIRDEGLVDRDREKAAAIPHFRLDHIAAAIAISFAICSVSNYISTRADLVTYNLLVVSTIAVLFANLMPSQMGRLEGDFSLGMLCMYVFFATIGAGTDAVGFIRSAPILFLYCSFMLAVHFAVLLLAGRWFKLDLAEVVIGSAAAIVGPAAAAAIASAKNWRTLVPAAITVGMLGYAIANFIGIAIYKLLS